MSFTSTALLTLAAAIVLIGALGTLVYEVFFQYRCLVNARFEELDKKSKTGVTSLFGDIKQLNAQVLSTRRSWHVRWQEHLAQAGLKIRLHELLAISISLGGAIGLATVAISKNWWAAPLGVLAGVAAPLLFINVKRRQRIWRISQQLPEAFDTIRRAVQSGQTVSAALQMVSDDFPKPISEEFRICYEQQNLGMPFDTTLRNLASRTDVMEMRILMVGLIVQSRSGGNLIELLNNLSNMVRKRLKMQQKIKALTGEGRMQAAVLLVLPILAFVSLLILAPEYIATLLATPWILTGTVIAQIVGAIWIRRIVRADL